MIRHASFGVSDPARVARALGELTGSVPVRAPTPPFPHGAWFVVFGDDFGSLVEVLPAAAAFDPDAPLGLSRRGAPSAPAATHVLITAAVGAGAIAAVAEREGWRIQEVETGLFRVVKLWIDDAVLVELLAEGETERYAAAFGAFGLASLDGKLRALEAELGRALAARMSPKQLSAVLGEPT